MGYLPNANTISASGPRPKFLKMESHLAVSICVQMYLDGMYSLILIE